MYSRLDLDNGQSVDVTRNSYTQTCDTINPPGIEYEAKPGELAALVQGERSETLAYVGVKRSGTPAEHIKIFTDKSSTNYNTNNIITESEKITNIAGQYSIDIDKDNGIELKNDEFKILLNSSGIELKNDEFTILLNSSGIELKNNTNSISLSQNGIDLSSSANITINGSVFTPDGDVFTSAPASYSLRQHIHPTPAGPSSTPNPPNPIP